MSDILNEAKMLQEELVGYRRKIHKNPEIGLHLPETKKFVMEHLKAFGYDPVEVGESGICAMAGNPDKGKCILVRADMDALPIKEETNLEFKSENGYMHACGHDMHTTMLLGAAKILKQHEGELKGCVKLMFQPAEETFQGARMMIDEGILDNPKVDAAITMHGDGMSEHKVGKLTLVRKGVSLASSDSYRIEVEGTGTHGAYPEQGVDPILVGAQIIVALQELIAREIKASDQVVLTQGIFQAGIAPNIIPDTAYMEGTVRTFNKSVREFLMHRMEEVTEHIAAAYRAKAKVIWKGGCPPLVNDPEVFEDVEKYLRELVGDDGLVIEGDEGVVFGAEDFATVLDIVPGVQMYLVTGCIADGAIVPMHNPKIVFDESPMYRGAAAFAYVAERWLEEHSV